MASRKGLFLLLAGLAIVSGSQLLMRQHPASDFANGLSVGVGIGLMIVAIILTKKKQRNPNF